MKTGKYKTILARIQILAYTKAIGWTAVSREEAERRCGFDPAMLSKGRTVAARCSSAACSTPRDVNPCYVEAESGLLRQFYNLHADIHGIEGQFEIGDT